jgi:periplasmic divalent cation tolerance protein
MPLQVDEQIAILYIPCGSEEEARTITETLLNEGLIACGNIYTSRSLYRWQGNLVDELEYVLFAKTTLQRAPQAELRVSELHSYSTPCIVTLRPESVNSSYSEWVGQQVGESARDFVATRSEGE